VPSTCFWYGSYIDSSLPEGIIHVYCTSIMFTVLSMVQVSHNTLNKFTRVSLDKHLEYENMTLNLIIFLKNTFF
jgi:hypothetical protein